MNEMIIDRDVEKRLWEAAAPAWGRWADAMSGMADKLNQHLIKAIELSDEVRVLDLASGAGEPAFSIARRLGAGGLVVGSDLSPGMLTAAAARADGTAPVAFAGADMTTLPFADNVFHAVTCRFGVMFVPDVDRAMAEIARVLRPGGRVALMVWGPLADNALFATLAETVNRALGPPTEDGDSGIDGLFRFAARDSLASLMRDAGFNDVSETEIKATRDAPVDEPFWRSALEMTFGHRIGALGPTDRAALEEAIVRAFAATAVERKGRVAVPLPLHARVIAGRKLPTVPIDSP